MSAIDVKPTDVKACFALLLDQWGEDTKYASFTQIIEQHPAYQEIVGMGTDVVPFLLRSIYQYPDHCMLALEALTGADPVPEEHYGNVEAMIDDWREWGKQNGY